MKKRNPRRKKEKQRLAVIGFGTLGRACARVIMADKKIELAGIVRRADQLGEKLLPPFDEVSAVSHISELRSVPDGIPVFYRSFADFFSILIPKRLTETSHHPVAGLHHSTVARAIPGVKKALSEELPAARGRRQRYLYVELEEGAVFEEEEKAIVGDPLFLDEETIVFPVESIAELEEEGRGILVKRHEDPACGH